MLLCRSSFRLKLAAFCTRRKSAFLLNFALFQIFKCSIVGGVSFFRQHPQTMFQSWFTIEERLLFSHCCSTSRSQGFFSLDAVNSERKEGRGAGIEFGCCFICLFITNIGNFMYRKLCQIIVIRKMIFLLNVNFHDYSQICKKSVPGVLPMIKL